MLDDHTNVDILMDQIASKHPDLLEVRLDKLHDRKLLDDIAKKKSFPLIVTDRSGRSQRSKLQLLRFAVASGFDMADLELTATNGAEVKQLKSDGASVIVSYHDYSQTPRKEKLKKVMEAERKLGCDIFKLVTTACILADNLTILSFVESEAANTKLVSFAMGRQGIMSRILSPLFGAEFTFASLTEDAKTAEGQLSIDDLRSAWRILGHQ
jgi:3-dehydroquinate dehydratase type I